MRHLLTIALLIGCYLAGYRFGMRDGWYYHAATAGAKVRRSRPPHPMTRATDPADTRGIV